MSKGLPGWKWVQEHQEQSLFLALGLWFVLAMLDTTLHVPWITLPTAVMELLAGCWFVRHSITGHVWPWYGSGLIGLGLATASYAFGGIFAPAFTTNSYLGFLLFPSALGLFIIIGCTFQTQWGMRQFGALGLANLLQVLESTDPEERASAVVLLGRLEDSRAVAPLVNALADTDRGVRAKAVVALGLIGDAKALPALQQIVGPAYVDDAEHPAKYVAEVAITRIQARTQRA
jgi:hypothetical protein